MFSKKAQIRQIVQVPLKNGVGTFYTFKKLIDKKEHLAIGFGDWERQDAPLVRVHSECLTGDVFASGKCDCGEQVQEAISKMQIEGGILLYLRQEGRGIGLYNKLDAYALQMDGHDTYESNRLLGFPDDLRNYAVVGQMLNALNKNKIKLLTNNPDKAHQLKALGIDVTETISTGVFLKAANKGYLQTKTLKTGHRINLEGLLSC